MRRIMHDKIKNRFKSLGYSDEEAELKADEALQYYDMCKDVAAAIGLNYTFRNPARKVWDKLTTVGKNVRKKFRLPTKHETFVKTTNSSQNYHNSQNSKGVSHSRPPRSINAAGGYQVSTADRVKDSLNDFTDKVKRGAAKVGDDLVKYGSKALKFAGRAAPALTALEFGYEANKAYHENLVKIWS